MTGRRNRRISRPATARTAAATGDRSTLSKLIWNHTKLWIAAVVGVVVAAALPAHWAAISRVLVGWNAAIWIVVPLTYLWMREWDAKQLRARYEEEDPTGPVILVVVVVAALLSVIAIVALLSTLKQVGPAERAAHTVLAALTIVDSWLIVHTLFTLHYADMFYSAPPDQPPLVFPETKAPVFWDFVYFAFTIAVACQTADVTTTQASMRKAVIAQSVIAFLFNISILGFAINVSAGLVGGN
jgi:uncharacterized membrane protein